MRAVRTNIKNWSREEWLQYRQNGIGGSEVASVMGVDAYRPAAQLWLQKIGMYPASVPENLAMFMGSYMEDSVAELWSYYGGDVETMMENYRTGNKVNKAKRVNAYLQNLETPWLIGSLDRQIVELDGKKRNGVLECKTINGYYAQKWEAGVPPAYVFQVQTYLHITGFDLAHIALLVDGRELRVVEIPADAELQAKIVERTREFWESVQLAKPLAEELMMLEAMTDVDEVRVQELKDALAGLEPGPDGSKAYEDFMRERYKTAMPLKMGSYKAYEMCVKYDGLNKSIAQLSSDQQLVKNELLAELQGAEGLEFGGGASVTYRVDSRGIRSIRVKVPDAVMAEA